jgi:hypothetical protein
VASRWRPEEAAEPVTSRTVNLSWVADRHCTDVDDGGQWLGSGVVELGRAGDRGGTDRGVEDGRVIEVAVRWLVQIGARVTGWSEHGGARGGTGCRGGASVEEPAMPGCSWTGAVGGRTS